MDNKNNRVLGLVQLGLFTGIIIIMAFTPYLGYIPLGFMNATIIHIPVIIGALFLGLKKGAILGFVFGLTSLINNTFNPNVTSFVFSPFYTVDKVSGGFNSLVICFVPRILIGVVAYLSYESVNRIMKSRSNSRTIAFAASGVLGSLTNTILVMSGIYLFFGTDYAAARGIAADGLYKVIFTIIGTQGIPEDIVSGIIVTVIGKVLYKFFSSRRP